MTQIFATNGEEFPAFLPVDCGFGGLYVVSGAGLDLDEAQDVVIPANQIDFAATVRRTEIAGHHRVFTPSKIEVSVFLTTPAGAQVARTLLGWQGSARNPVKNADRGVCEATGDHRRKRAVFVAPASTLLAGRL